MGFGRKMSRQMSRKKIETAAAHIDRLSQQVPEMLPYLNQLRNVVAHMLEQQDALRYEMMRTRAVTMRFALSRYFPEILDVEGDHTIDTLGGHFLEMEEQFRAEYDALIAMAYLGSLAGGETTDEAPSEEAVSMAPNVEPGVEAATG